MPKLSRKRPVEGSTTSIECSFKDVNNSLILNSVIDSMIWELRDSNGEIVNNRSNVSVNTITNPITIFLTGDDLPSGRLTFTINVIYDSVSQSNLNLKDSITFYVDNLTYND